MLGRWKLIISTAFHLDKVNAICRFYFLFLDISKPNAEIFTGFLRPDPAWNFLKTLKLMFTIFVLRVASVSCVIDKDE